MSLWAQLLLEPYFMEQDFVHFYIQSLTRLQCSRLFPVASCLLTSGADVCGISYYFSDRDECGSNQPNKQNRGFIQTTVSLRCFSVSVSDTCVSSVAAGHPCVTLLSYTLFPEPKNNPRKQEAEHRMWSTNMSLNSEQKHVAAVSKPLVTIKHVLSFSMEGLS